MRHASVIWALSLLVCLAGTAQAADGGFRLPSLNPFKSDKKPASARVSDKSSWVPALPKVPTMPGFKSSTPSRAARKAPSTMSRMTQGTKSFFSKTYDVLTPWDNGGPSKPPTQMGVRRSSSKKESSSFFNWFKSEPEQEVRTVNDFINLPRPHFDE